MRIVVGLCLLGACGRIGFDTIPDPPYVEPGGQLDPTFGSDGVTVVGNGTDNLALYDVIPRDVGGFLCIGPHTLAGLPRFGLFGFTADGKLDPGFGNAGIMDTGPTSDFGYGTLRLADGRVLVNGDGDDGSGSMDDITIGLIDQNGTVDPSFGVAGFRRFDVLAAKTADTSQRAAQVGSHVVVCGTAGYSIADSHFVLISLGLDGAMDASFGTGGMVTTDFHPGVPDGCSDVVALPDGNLAAAGETANHALVATFRPDGSRDPSFAGGALIEIGTPFAASLAITLAPDGDLVIAGESNNQGLVARFAPDGSPRSGFGQAGIVELPSATILFGVAVQPNGKIIVVGASPAQTAVVVRLTADGALDPTFATGGVFELPMAATAVFQRAVFAPNGDIVAVGYIGLGTPYRGMIVRLR